MNVRADSFGSWDIDLDGDLAWAIEGVELEWMCVP